MNSFFRSLCFFFACATLAGAQEKPVVYNHLTPESADLDPVVRKALEAKYSVIDFREATDYEQPKGIAGKLPRCAKTESGEPLGGKVTIAYVVNGEGRVVDPVVLASTDKRLDAVATRAMEEWRFTTGKRHGAIVAVAAVQTFEFEVAPTEFVEQILEPTGGKISKPKAWFYAEAHHEKVYLWTLSREDQSGGKKYDTGVRIQTFVGVKEGAGKSAKQFILDFVESKKKSADKVLKTCEPKDQGLFTRVCLETEEGPHHILYSLFWGANDLDVAVVTIAGTRKELWDTYSPTFDKMNSFELIDPKRFEKK